VNSSEDNTIQKITDRKEKKPKDYKKLSRIKTVIFLILAAAVLSGMYFTERSGKKNSAEPKEAVFMNSAETESGDVK